MTSHNSPLRKGEITRGDTGDSHHWHMVMRVNGPRCAECHPKSDGPCPYCDYYEGHNPECAEVTGYE